MTRWEKINEHSEDAALVLGCAFGLAAVLAQIMFRTFVLPLLIGSVMLFMMWCFASETPAGGESQSPNGGLEAEKAADQGVIHSP